MVHKQQSVFEKDIAIINDNKLTCKQIDVETIDPGQGKYLHVKQTLDMENNDARNIGLCEATSIMAGTANVGGKLTTTDLDVLGQLATSGVNAATVTAGKYVIKTHNNAVADALLYNVNLPNTLICPMLTFRANELQCAQINGNGSSLKFVNCSEIDFNNIPIANWAGPQGGGGGGSGGDPFPVHDGVYQVDRSMELAFGKTLTV